jgi:hypothetical protein
LRDQSRNTAPQRTPRLNGPDIFTDSRQRVSRDTCGKHDPGLACGRALRPACSRGPREFERLVAFDPEPRVHETIRLRRNDDRRWQR